MLRTELLKDDEYTAVVYEFRVESILGRVIVLLSHDLRPREIVISLPGASDAMVAEYADLAKRMTQCLDGGAHIEEVIHKFGEFRVGSEFGGRTSEVEIVRVRSVVEIVFWWLRYKLPLAISNYRGPRQVTA